MSDVRYPQLVFLTVVAFSATGCAELQLSRFAPPGVVKYEDIAGEKEPNPTIVEVIETQKETSTRDYPRLAETPSKKDRPKKRPLSQVDAEIDELATARDELIEHVAEARLEAEADLAERPPLLSKREEMQKQIELDAATAEAERKEAMPSPEY